MEDVVVQDPKPVSSWKTTVAGIIAALGLVGEQLQRGWPDGIADWIALLLKAFGPVLLGFFARDKNVSSEGHKVVTPEGKPA